MKKTFTFEGCEYTVSTCTAIAASIGDTDRQDALLVENTTDSGETVRFIVFGYDMPDDEADFEAMADDSTAWDSESETLETVIC